MKVREMYAEAEQLASERGWAEADPHFMYLLELLSLRATARHQIENHSEAIRHNLDSLAKMTGRPDPILNSLGELQALPAHLEGAVGEFAATQKALSTYLRSFPPLEPQ